MIESQDVYRCNKSKCKKIFSLRSGTIFAKTTHSIKILVLLMYFWVCEYPVRKTAFQLGLDKSRVLILAIKCYVS